METRHASKSQKNLNFSFVIILDHKMEMFIQKYATGTQLNLIY